MQAFAFVFEAAAALISTGARAARFTDDCQDAASRDSLSIVLIEAFNSRFRAECRNAH